MPVKTNEFNISARATELEQRWAGRTVKRRIWRAMIRGFDPRDKRVAASTGAFWSPEDYLNLRPLYTNDAATYASQATHMLSGRPINWKLPGAPVDSPGQLLKQGKAERLLYGIFQQNDRRLISKGMQRLQRSVAWQVANTGTIVVYRQAITRGAETHFIIEPWNPDNVFESFGDDGLAEVARKFTMNLDELIARAEVEDGWNVKSLKDKFVGRDTRGRFSRKAPDVVVLDYWRKRLGPNGGQLVENGIAVEGEHVKPLAAEDEIEIPVEIAYANGEAHAGDDSGRISHSLIENGVLVTLQNSDLLKKVYDHAHKTMAADYQEFTHGGQPRADVEDLDPTDESGKPRTGVSRTTYDSSRQEKGLSPVPQNPIDRSVVDSLAMQSGMMQRAFLPYTFFGETQFQISGFAIQKLREGALAAVGEAAVVMETLFGRLGRWVLETTRDGGNASIRVSGFVPSTLRREYFHEVINKSVIPQFLNVQAEVPLAIPSDLTERINQARASKPGAIDLITSRTLYQELLSDIVADPQAEIDGIEEEALKRLPAYQQIQVHAAVRRQLDKAKDDGDDTLVQFWQKELQVLEQTMLGAPNQGAQSGDRPGMAPSTLSTPAQQQGVPSAMTSPVAPQLGG